MSSQKPPRPDAEPTPAGPEQPPADGSSVDERLSALERATADAAGAIRLILDHLRGAAKDAPRPPGQVPSSGAYVIGPDGRAYATMQPGPSQVAPGGAPPQDIPPGMLQLMAMAKDAFAPQSGSDALTRRLLEGSLGLLDAQLAKARSDASLSELIVKRAASKLADSVAGDVTRAFD